MIKILKTEQEKRQGLMGIPYLAPNDGALFVYDKSDILYFWGKDTLINLDIAFIRSDGTIAKIAVIQANDERGVGCEEPCLYALEMNEGWFDKNGYSVGSKIDIMRKEGSSRIQDFVLERLPIDIYDVVKDVPVEFRDGEIRGEQNNSGIVIYNDGTNDDYVKWTLAHEYWHAFLNKKEHLDPEEGLGKEIIEEAESHLANQYYDDRKRELALDFFKRHLTKSNISDPEYVLYNEMFADGLADMVIGNGNIEDVIKSYADNWVQDFIYEKYGSLE